MASDPKVEQIRETVLSTWDAWNSRNAQNGVPHFVLHSNLNATMRSILPVAASYARRSSHGDGTSPLQNRSAGLQASRMDKNAHLKVGATRNATPPWDRLWLHAGRGCNTPAAPHQAKGARQR